MDVVIGHDVSKNVQINSKDLELLNIVRKNPEYTRDEIAKTMGISVSTVSNIMSKLKASGRIMGIGSNNIGEWKVNGSE